MKLLSLLLVFLCICRSNVQSQVIHGKVLNVDTQLPLAYVNIGIMGRDIGTISDESGNFVLNPSILPAEAKVRFSMIGFESRIFDISSFYDNITITLTEVPTLLNEVIVSSSAKRELQLGETTNTKKHLAGWGGYGVGAGSERGIRIDSEQFPLYPKVLGVNIARNAYDSILLRFHIRYLDNDLPAKEILPENLLHIFKGASGSVIIDISKYNLTIDKPVSVSVEWVKAWGSCKGASCFLQFSVNPSKGTLYMKEASDGVWKKFKPSSPGIFINCAY